jgi:hypothetical protein
MIFRALQAVGWCFVIAAAIAICVIAGRGPSAGNPVVEYKDFVSILLTALGVMIAVGAVVAAVGAFYGFEVLRREVVHAAAEAARKAAESTATQVAQTKVDEIVPGLVEKSMKIDRQVTATEADKIAKEFGKEP